MDQKEGDGLCVAPSGKIYALRPRFTHEIGQDVQTPGGRFADTLCIYLRPGIRKTIRVNLSGPQAEIRKTVHWEAMNRA